MAIKLPGSHLERRRLQTYIGNAFPKAPKRLQNFEPAAEHEQEQDRLGPEKSPQLTLRRVFIQSSGKDIEENGQKEDQNRAGQGFEIGRRFFLNCFRMILSHQYVPFPYAFLGEENPADQGPDKTWSEISPFPPFWKRGEGFNSGILGKMPIWPSRRSS